MISQEIENQLQEWFEGMMSKYPIRAFKYEYNEKRRTYLVSTTIDINDVKYDAYCEEAMRFEDFIVDLYGDDAPLFTDNEQLFLLSADAYVVMASYVEAPKVEIPYATVQYAVETIPALSMKDVIFASSKQTEMYSGARYWADSQPRVYKMAA